MYITGIQKKKLSVNCKSTTTLKKKIQNLLESFVVCLRIHFRLGRHLGYRMVYIGGPIFLRKGYT